MLQARDLTGRMLATNCCRRTRPRLWNPKHSSTYETRPVEYRQQLAAQAGVALRHAHIAAEGRRLILVAHFQRRRLDMHRLVAVLRKPCSAFGDLFDAGWASSADAVISHPLVHMWNGPAGKCFFQTFHHVGT